MKRIISITLLLISVSSFAQNKYYDVQRVDSFYAKLFSGSSTDSVVTVNALGKFYKRNASAFGISGITADNGLTANTSTNVQLGSGTPLTGSPFLHDTYLNGDVYSLNVYSSAATGMAVQNTNNGVGLYTQSGTGFALKSFSNSIVAQFQTRLNSTNTIEPIIQVQRRTFGTPAAGEGGSIDFYLDATTPVIELSNQLISKWTDATDATRTSQFSITGVNSGTTNTLLTLDGDQTATFFGNVHLNNSGSLYLQTTNSFSGDMPANSQPVINSINSNRVEAINLGAYTYVLTSAAASLSLSSNSVYSFTGTTSTWTLPAITSNTGMSLVLKNRGSGTITLNTNAGATDIYDTSAISTMNITAGQCIRLVNDGTYWIVISKY